MERGDDKPESLVELIKNLSVKNEMAICGSRKQNIALKKNKQHNEYLYNVEEWQEAGEVGIVLVCPAKQ